MERQSLAPDKLTTDIDRVLSAIAHQLDGIEGLLRAFFGFLQRQTDFYDAGDEQCTFMLHRIFSEYYEKRQEAKSEFGKIPDREPPNIEEVLDEQDSIVDVIENNKTIATNRSNLNDNSVKGGFQEKTVSSQKNCEDNEETCLQYTESRRTKKGSVYPNEGDGATYKYYKWYQTPLELEVLVPLCSHQLQHKSSIKITYTATNLSMEIPDLDYHFGGVLADKIKPEETTWTIEDKVLIVRTEKATKSWWKQLLQKEPMLLIKPILRRHSTVGDIDPDTMEGFQKTVNNKKDYIIRKHKEQFPDKLPIPDNLK